MNYNWITTQIYSLRFEDFRKISDKSVFLDTRVLMPVLHGHHSMWLFCNRLRVTWDILISKTTSKDWIFAWMCLLGVILLNIYNSGGGIFLLYHYFVCFSCADSQFPPWTLSAPDHTHTHTHHVLKQETSINSKEIGCIDLHWHKNWGWLFRKEKRKTSHQEHLWCLVNLNACFCLLCLTGFWPIWHS